MTISSKEAINLLKKWHEERRLIRCSLVFSDETSSSVAGPIEAVNDGGFTIRAQDDVQGDGAVNGISVEVSGAVAVAFEESDEARMLIDFGSFRCEIQRLKISSASR